jgi:prevent-host-death family protein
MERIAKSKARKDFAGVIRRASEGGARIKITHYGKTMAGVISPKDLKTLEDCEGRSGKSRRKRVATR